MTAVAELMETTSRGSHVIDQVMLLALDAPSTAFPADPLDWSWPLRAPSDGTEALSCERWLQMRFTPPFGAILNCRFWVPDYAPSPGWSMLWGVSDTYRNPSTSRSAIAVRPLPTTDPVIGNLGPTIPGPAIGFTLYLVLQASWRGDPGLIQDPPAQVTISWEEAS